MSELGIGVMLHSLSGGSEESASTYYGKTIKEAKLDGNILLTFTDGVKIKISDDGQSCCEHRYMTSDDDFNELIGKKLTEIEVKRASSAEEDGWATHEIAFLEIKAEDSWVTVETHNVHNGYYGGFGLSIKEVKE